MPTTAEVAAEHYAAQLRQAEAAVLLARRQWRKMDPADLQRSWAQIVDRLALVVGSSQLGAARAGSVYVPEALAEDIAPEGTVNPSRWAGIASDGRALDTLLYSAVVRTLDHLGSGDSQAVSLAAGGKWLDTIVRTQVADAGRGAAGVAIAARRDVGYVRMVSPPCCQRCAVLAGKFFKWNAGFNRHPKCDCRHVPSTSGVPDGLRSHIDPSEIKDLTADQRKAISDGSDLNQVINAHRPKRRSADGMTTSEGATRRGLAGSRLNGKQRLTPEAIYRVSATREEALRRLRNNGYLL